MGLLSGSFKGKLDQETELGTAAVVLTPEHRDALDGCYDTPQSLAEVDDDEWMQQLHDLRVAGLVTFDDAGTEATITDAGIDYMDRDDEGVFEEEPEHDPEQDYDGEYTDILDLFYDGPLRAAEFRERDEWDLIQPLLDNGHLIGPDELDHLHITEAGIAVLDA